MKIKFEIEKCEEVLDTAIQIRRIQKELEKKWPDLKTDFVYKEKDEFQEAMEKFKKTIDIWK